MQNLNLNPIAVAFAPQSHDIAYDYDLPLEISLILRMDSYKFAHPFAYRKGMIGMSCYGTARVDPSQPIVMAGMQHLLKSHFTKPITMEQVEQAQHFALAHFGRPLFAYLDWKDMVERFNGLPPLVIRALPEGTVVRGGDPLYTVSCFDERLAWQAAAFETIILRGVWYPTTIATDDYMIKPDIEDYYRLSGADMGMLPFSVHDFGGRGVTCGEQAEIGGAAHLYSFMGSDTIEGILAANHIYKDPMAAYSVYATEHSVECSFGLDVEGEKAYLRHQIEIAHRLELPIASLVIDGRDTMRCAAVLCSPEFVELVKSKSTKIVFRPDSGDMFEIVPKIIVMQQEAYGYTVTSTGHRSTKYVGVIQGDGVDHSAIRTLLGNLLILGYAADCVIFGSGGALLQKVNRDTYKFAQKASAVLIRDWIDSEHQEIGDEVNGMESHWFGIAKDPITDPGKKSREGVLTLIRNHYGDLETWDMLDGLVPPSATDLHKLVYHCGALYNEVTLSEIRNRVNAAQ